MHILHVVGVRPNFMKVAPLMDAINHHNFIKQTLVHTGQHYDRNMSQIFFQQLSLPEPDINLEVGSGSHAVQTAEIMVRFEKVVRLEQPDWVMVYGDVNSTIATSLVCSKLQIPVAHVEAGLRSGDRRMPEEINRLLTDQIASLLFTSSQDADENLKKEGVSSEKIHFVGNTMIDSLVRLLPSAQQLPLPAIPEKFVLVTLHRPSNVDDPRTLQKIIAALSRISKRIPILFPIHPRTRKQINDCGIHLPVTDGLILMEPLGYLEFLALQNKALLVVTDSGGIQEETTYLRIPCLTMRENTERPVTITLGTNILIGNDTKLLEDEIYNIIGGKIKRGEIPPLWDGTTGKRIVDIMLQYA